MVEELAEVCKDYCKETWIEAPNLAGVPAALEWRPAGSVYYPPDIREAPAALPSSFALALESSEQPLTALALLPPSEVSKWSNQAGDQGQGVEVAKDKGKGKETEPPLEAKDTAKAKDVIEAKDAVVKAKEVKAKSKKADLKAKGASASQPSEKDNPPPTAKA